MSPEFKVGEIVKLAGDVLFTSRSTGREWDLPKGRRVRIHRVINMTYALESLDGKMRTRVVHYAVEALPPLEQLASCAEEDDDE